MAGKHYIHHRAACFCAERNMAARSPRQLVLSSAAAKANAQPPRDQLKRGPVALTRRQISQQTALLTSSFCIAAPPPSLAAADDSQPARRRVSPEFAPLLTKAPYDELRLGRRCKQAADPGLTPR